MRKDGRKEGRSERKGWVRKEGRKGWKGKKRDGKERKGREGRNKGWRERKGGVRKEGKKERTESQDERLKGKGEEGRTKRRKDGRKERIRTVSTTKRRNHWKTFHSFTLQRSTSQLNIQKGRRGKMDTC
jgi:hypothetical protein